MRKSRRKGIEIEAAVGEAFGNDKEKLHYARLGVNAFFSW